MDRKRGFTLIELLVVIAVVAILAAILFPVFAQAREKARQSTCLSNCKQWGSAFMMYVQDHDERYPLAFGYDRSLGGWVRLLYHQVPAGWRPLTPNAARRQIAPALWANSLQPYLKSYGGYACLSGAEVRVDNLAHYQAPASPWANISYTFNGLLMAYPQAAVVTPSRLPLLWEGEGKAFVAGGGLSNPFLYCDDPNDDCQYRPRSASGCAPGNGGRSNLWVPQRTMWVHNHGAVFVAADGSARWRRLGARVPGPNDPRVDPFWGYDASGVGTVTWSDGCHVWLFRPDFEQS